MRKISIFLVIVLTIVAAIGFKYMSYKNEYNAIQKENKEFEEYKDKEVYGLEVGTMINKAVDKNTKNKIEKDNNGNFIQNDKNSIEIEIYITDNETTYKMETLSIKISILYNYCYPLKY